MDNRMVEAFPGRDPFLLESLSPCAMLGTEIYQKLQVLVSQLRYESYWSDRVHLSLETVVFSWSVQKAHTRIPKCPSFHCNTHLSSNIQEPDTTGSICNRCKVQDCACLYRNQDRLLWRDFPWSKCFRVWYLCERCLFYAWTPRLLGPGTCRTWFSDMLGDFSYFLTLHINSCP